MSSTPRSLQVRTKRITVSNYKYNSAVEIYTEHFGHPPKSSAELFWMMVTLARTEIYHQNQKKNKGGVS